MTISSVISLSFFDEQDVAKMISNIVNELKNVFVQGILLFFISVFLNLCKFRIKNKKMKKSAVAFLLFSVIVLGSCVNSISE